VKLQRLAKLTMKIDSIPCNDLEQASRLARGYALFRLVSMILPQID
jgi:hypothetical protein